MIQKWIGILIIIITGVLFSYLPVTPVEHCPMGSHEANHHDGDHPGGSHKEEGQSNCGYIFHCPFAVHPSFSEPMVILNTEKLVIICLPTTF